MKALNAVLLILLINTTSKTSFRIEGFNEDQSFENLIYYKDHKKINEKPIKLQSQVITERSVPKSDCPCPRMCCSMCCDCDTQPLTSVMSRQMSPIQQMKPMMNQMSGQFPPFQHPQQKVMRKKIMRGPPRQQFKDSTRRSLGSTREHIKGLISQDEDIKNILKDLVRVTIMKVNQREMGKEQKNVRDKPHKENIIEESDEEETESE